jgi:hypothetical protein
MATHVQSQNPFIRKDPLDAILRSVPLLESLERRFAAKVDQRGPKECWPWTAGTTACGYGRMSAAGHVNLKAPRVAYALEIGVSPGSWDVCHECDNPACCNPDHLFLGKPLDNARDAVSKGRNVPPPTHRGTAHPRAKLSDETIRTIRMSKTPSAQLAVHLGVSQRHINRVRSGEGWSHVA